MTSFIKIVAEVNDTAQTAVDKLNLHTVDASSSLQKLGAYIQGLCIEGGSVKINTGAVKATCAFTFTGAPTAAQTLTINGVTFTARASGATGDEFNIGISVTATAANMAAAVNASATAGITGIVTASSALGVCTISAISPGKEGNYLIAPTESMDNTTVTGWTGGAETATVTLAQGI